MVPQLQAADNGEAGMITPVFAVTVLGLGLIASAYLIAAQMRLDDAKRDWAKVVAIAALEGETNKIAWALIQEDGRPTLEWNERVEGGEVTLIAESEASKIAPEEVDRPENLRIIDAISASQSDRIAKRLGELSRIAKEGVSRADIVSADITPGWRRCANTLVSPYSRLTGIALARPRPPQFAGAAHLRPGEIWRLSAIDHRGWWLDREVRFTGDESKPIAVIEQSFGFDKDRFRQDCLADLDRLGALHD